MLQEALFVNRIKKFYRCRSPLSTLYFLSKVVFYLAIIQSIQQNTKTKFK